MHKLQIVQNFAARIITGIRKYDHITPGLKELRWLPVKAQPYFRDAVLAFKCINDQAPSYLDPVHTIPVQNCTGIKISRYEPVHTITVSNRYG